MASELPTYPLHIGQPIAPQSKKSPKPFLLIIIVIVVIALVGAAAWCYFKETLGGAKGLGSSLLVSIGQSPDVLLYSLPLTSSSTPKTYEPAFAMGRFVLDYAGDATTSYYILENGNQIVSNIYSESATTTKAVATLVTDTPSFKSDVAYDAPAHVLAFVSSNSKNQASGSVVLLNTVTNTQKTIGQGTDPVLLSGGIMVLLREGNTLEVINSVSGAETNLVSISTSSPFAVTPDGQTLVLYNPPVHAIDYFSISNVTSASYEHSEPAPIIPTAMAFKGSQLYLAGTLPSNASVYAIQIEGSSKPLATFTLPDKSSTLQKIIFP